MLLFNGMIYLNNKIVIKFSDNVRSFEKTNYKNSLVD